MEKEVLEKLAEFEEIESVEQFIKDNKAEFPHGDFIYRVTLPTLQDKEELRRQRLKKVVELKSNPDILTRDQVIRAYSGTEDDIGMIDQKMIQLRQQMDELSVKAFKQESNDSAVANLQEKFDELKIRFVELSQQKTELLSGCLESELNLFCVDYLTYLVLSKKNENNEFVRVFKSFEEYQKVNDPIIESLLNRASVFANHLISMNVF